jgi:flagellar basal-body rod protein FlgG
MSEGLYIGAAGMRAQQQNVDTIANNLANANTNGFKKGRISFTEMMVQDISRSAQQVSDSDSVLTQLRHTGIGVSVANAGKIFEFGELKKTESAMDLAILGDGFFEIAMHDGTTAYSRGGSLVVNKDGLLSLPSGLALKPSIAVPDNVQSIAIAGDGTVQFRVAGQASLVDAGRLDLVRFMNPNQLAAQADGVYLATEGSGQAMTSLAGENGVGTVSQGFLEASNVKMIDEMVNLMVAQRTYEANVKLVQAADEMLGMINNLRK